MRTPPSKRAIAGKAKSEGITLLTEVESKGLLAQAGISVIETTLATSRDRAVTMSKQLGFPVALKITSPDIVHKTDAGGVKLGLNTPAQVSRAYGEVMSTARRRYPQARIRGVAVQKMARPGVEVIIGMSRDAQFGPVLMFGLGGTWVEILKDVSFRIIPITRRDAREMVQEIRAYPLLTGYRGQEPVDISKLEDLLLKVSDFVEANPKVKELDINPVLAYSDAAIAVDARIILDGEGD